MLHLIHRINRRLERGGDGRRHARPALLALLLAGLALAWPGHAAAQDGLAPDRMARNKPGKDRPAMKQPAVNRWAENRQDRSA